MVRKRYYQKKKTGTTVRSRFVTNQQQLSRPQQFSHENSQDFISLHASSNQNENLIASSSMAIYKCMACATSFDNESQFIKHNNTSKRCRGKNTIFTCYNCYRSFASRKNLDKHLQHRNYVQCNSKHYNNEYLNAHGSTLFMDIEQNIDSNSHLVHVSQPDTFPFMSEYARRNINMSLLNINTSSCEDIDSDTELEGDALTVDFAMNDADSINSNTTDSGHLRNSDTSMIERKKKIDKLRSITCYENDYMAALELEDILHRAKAPLGLFNTVMNWARRNHDYIPTRADIFTRNKLYEASKGKLYGTISEKKKKDSIAVSSNEPKLIHCTLPSNRSITVPTYSFKEHVCNLLSDKRIMKKENLIYKSRDGDHFHVDSFNNGMYGDVHQSDWFQESMALLINDPENELLVPVLFYLDALVLDAYGKLSLEPLSFTLGIFLRHLRNQKHAHRTLGFVEDLDHLHGANQVSPEQKANDYHHILSIILEDFKKTQREGGFDWDFVIDGVTYRKKLRFHLMFIIGDCKGHDMVCGRVSAHTTKGLCRDCDCTLASADDPMVKCTMFKQSDIEVMDKKDLKNISFRKLRKNAFSGLEYGANIWGINRATPPEPLHLILLGICMFLVDSLYSELPAQAMAKLDELVAKISSDYGRQSDRNMPDIRPFRSGLSKTSRLTAKQKYGRIFNIFLALNTESFALEVTQTSFNRGSGGHKRNYNQQQYRKLLTIFEDVLLYYKWVCKAEHPREHFIRNEHGESIASDRLRSFMADYIAAAPRHTGLELKLVKIHQLLHWCLIIPYYGSGLNVDSGRGEANASPNAKDHGKHTQKRAVTLNQQTATRLHEQQIFDEARLHCGIVADDIDFMDPEDLSDEDLINRENLMQERTNNRTSGEAGGSKFVFHIVYSPTNEMDTNNFSLSWLSKHGTTRRFNNPILSAIGRRLVEINRTRVDSLITSVEGFTELDKFFTDDESNKIKFRAHPGYYDGRPWHDWAIVRWASGEDLEAKLQMFLNFEKITVVPRTRPWVPPPSTVRTPSGTEINIRDATPKGLHAVISTCVDNPTDKSRAFMKTKLGKRLDIAMNQQIVSTDSILGTAYVIEEEIYPETGTPKRVVSYKHVTKWGSLFLPNDWNFQHESRHLNVPNESDDDNNPSTEVIIEENRATLLAETFDGFVQDYVEES